jgi:hypothetical protein
MQCIRRLQNSAMEEELGAHLAEDSRPNPFLHGDDNAIQSDLSKLRVHAHFLKRHRRLQSGLRCASFTSAILHAAPLQLQKLLFDVILCNLLEVSCRISILGAI